MKALVIGATGLVGKHITENLLNNPGIDEVHVFVRRSMPFHHPKLTTHIIDFETDDWLKDLSGDVLFSALGTTIKDAGSKEVQYRIDHDYQLKVAKAASQNGVKAFVLISSVNADAKSKFFYLRMKGELDEKVKELSFSSISLIRPGPLKGKREHERLNEKISVGILEALPKFLVKPSMKPVDGNDVAKFAIKVGLKSRPGVRIYQPHEILGNKD